MVLQVFLSKDMKFNAINNIRFLTKYRQEPYLSLKKILGFTPRRIELYEMALRHRSATSKNDKGEVENNERLEFLGDAVLTSIVSDVLYHRYKNKTEGFLTNARSNIVKRNTLNKISQEIGLANLVITNKKTQFKTDTNIYGNTLEAFVGAVYLDVGYEKCAQFVKEKLLVSREHMMNIAEDNKNFKSELLEWCQQKHYSMDFKLLSDVVDNRNRHTFTSELLINDQSVCTGIGTTKRASEQQACKEALKKIKQGTLLINE